MVAFCVIWCHAGTAKRVAHCLVAYTKATSTKLARQAEVGVTITILESFHWNAVQEPAQHVIWCHAGTVKRVAHCLVAYTRAKSTVLARQAEMGVTITILVNGRLNAELLPSQAMHHLLSQAEHCPQCRAAYHLPSQAVHHLLSSAQHVIWCHAGTAKWDVLLLVA